MTRSRHTWPSLSVTAITAALALATGCTSAPTHRTSPAPAGGLRLIAFDSCADALSDLRAAARAQVGPWGFGTAGNLVDERADRQDTAGLARAAGAGAPAPGTEAGGASGGARPDHSGTNTHEAGVDEPDLVKTDGRRIVTVRAGTLRVIDPATRRLTGSVDLRPAVGTPGWLDANLLLHGDRALVLVPVPPQSDLPPVDPGAPRPGAAAPAPGDPPAPDAGAPGTGTGVDPVGPAGPGALAGPGSSTRSPVLAGGAQLLLVDLTGQPRVAARYRIDGYLVDARQTGGTARVVVRSAPRISFPDRQDQPEPLRVAANRTVVDQAPIDSWLPRYELTDGTRTSSGRVGCDRVHRPATYSGTSMLTILSFDLAGAGLGDGDPVTVVADGDTVYGTDRHLYIAGTGWRSGMPPARDAGRTGPEVTEIYQFATGPGRPRYRAATSVPGRLLNQYAMSEWAGHLRVATTSSGDEVGGPAAEPGVPDSSSAVYVLRADGKKLVETGRVTGLGRGERIFGVRFVGDTGYVVTFRQTDPLYTVDLRDPGTPVVRGALKITGYSAYLHPVGPGRLLGVGQEASTEGRVRGTQLSLFDVSDPAAPVRLARYHVERGQSAAEFDPHAFLYWPATGTVVVPVVTYPNAEVTRPAEPAGTALVLRISGDGFTEAGWVDHRTARTAGGAETGTIQRSLVVDGVLWTFSDLVVKATDLSTMATLATLRT